MVMTSSESALGSSMSVFQCVPYKGTELLAGQAVTDLPLVDQIPAVEDGHTGEVLKGIGDQIKIFSDTTDAGVRVVTGDDGIFVFHSGSCFSLLNVSMKIRIHTCRCAKQIAGIQRGCPQV